MEIPSYASIDGLQLYQVLHRPAHPRAVALLVGPFATERPYSYSAWARWARFLASKDIAALRFDFRGVGESTGSFSASVFGDNILDTVHCAAVLESHFPGLPLLVHGLGFGGLIAGEAFKRGVGRALLTWSAPATGREAMKDACSRRLMMDFVVAGPKRRTWDDYVADLENGGSIVVQGYSLSSTMWRESQQYSLPPVAAAGAARPIHHVKLGRDAAPLVPGLGQWRALNPALQTGFAPLNPDFSKLFGETAEWLGQNLFSAV